MCERNINWLFLTCPQPGTWPATQACALTRNWISKLPLCGTMPNPLSHTSQGCHLIFLCLLSLSSPDSSKYVWHKSDTMPTYLRVVILLHHSPVLRPLTLCLALLGHPSQQFLVRSISDLLVTPVFRMLPLSTDSTGLCSPVPSLPWPIPVPHPLSLKW